MLMKPLYVSLVGLQLENLKLCTCGFYFLLGLLY